MKLTPAAHYDDAAGNSFVFFLVVEQPHCYVKTKTGHLRREPEWGGYPRQTIETLLRIVGWLKLDRPSSNPLHDTRFRYSNPNSCSDCGGMYA
jgi:hypothetical protein